MEIEAYFWEFNLPKQNPFIDRPIIRGKVLEVSPRRVRGRSAEDSILGEGVWCLAEVRSNSAKSEVC
jgi:hypothetical protein